MPDPHVVALSKLTRELELLIDDARNAEERMTGSQEDTTHVTAWLNTVKGLRQVVRNSYRTRVFF